MSDSAQIIPQGRRIIRAACAWRYAPVLLALALVFVVLAPFSLAQERQTPLGVQRSFPEAGTSREPTVPPAPTVQETPGQTVSRALAAHGAQWGGGQILDYVAEGKLTYFAAGALQVTFDMTLL